MKNQFFEIHQFIANYLAKYPNSYESLELGNQTQTHRYIAGKLNVDSNSFKMLRDEYDGFYGHRKGFPDPYKRKSRVEYKTKFENINQDVYLRKIIQLLDNPSFFTPVQYNDEDLDVDLFEEGSKIKVIINKYERNLAAKIKCIEHYGRKCFICGFKDYENFGTKIGIIEVHHLIPISQIKGKYKVNPLEDLVPLCPNCHRAIHSRIPAYSIAELQKIIKTIC